MDYKITIESKYINRTDLRTSNEYRITIVALLICSKCQEGYAIIQRCHDNMVFNGISRFNFSDLPSDINPILC